MSTIDEATYCFELDSKGNLHVHGICSSEYKLQYSSLHRSWGVHHNFSQLFPPRYSQYTAKPVRITKIVAYITKNPVANLIIKQFKEMNMNINTLAYWIE